MPCTHLIITQTRQNDPNSVGAVRKEEVRDRLPPLAYRLYERFTYCAACQKIYWQGGHYERILASLEGLIVD